MKMWRGGGGGGIPSTTQINQRILILFISFSQHVKKKQDTHCPKVT